MKNFIRLAGWLIMASMALLVSPVGTTSVHAQLEPARFAFDECSTTEAWVPVGEGLPGTVFCAEILNDELYVVSTVRDTVKELSKWDGTSWTTLSAFVLPRGPVARTVADLQVYNGDIYLSGSFTSVDHIPETEGLARWDGTAWSSVPGNQMRNGSGFIPLYEAERMFAMTTYKGELYVSGQFPSDPDEQNRGIRAWNGTTWRIIAESVSSAQTPPDSTYITSFAEWRGDLYVGGFFSRIGGTEAHGVARWDGTAWHTVGTKDMRDTRQLCVFQDRLYAVRESVDRYSSPPNEIVASWDGTEWRQIPGVVLKKFQSGILASQVPVVEYNGEMTMIISGAEGTPFRAGRWDGSHFQQIARPNDNVNFLIEYKGDLYAGGAFTSSCNLQLNHIAKLCTPLNCFGVSGRVVKSMAGDCTDVPSKPGNPRQLVEMTPGPVYAVTDDEGRYRIYADTGSHALRLVPQRNWEQICPDQGGRYDITVTRPGESLVDRDFVTAPLPGRRDLRLSLAGNRIRGGQATSYMIQCFNSGTADIANATVHLEYNPRLMIDSVVPTSTVTGNGRITWNLNNLLVGESQTLKIYLAVPVDMSIGTVVCANVWEENSDDAFASDNRDSLCAQVVNSYDPNDMMVRPGAGNLAPITLNDTVLTYTVRFQNTGSDTAYRVVVIDTLDALLELASLQLGASSHPYKLKIGSGRALSFVFDDAGLPGYKENVAASQGYLTFSLRWQPEFRPGKTILNRAFIYFDYNVPIKTNTVGTILESFQGAGYERSGENDDEMIVRIYPNPARGYLYLRGLRKGAPIELANMIGERVLSVQATGEPDMELDLSSLLPGTYLVSFETPNGRQTRTVTLLR